jgi:hypothetical protein
MPRPTDPPALDDRIRAVESRLMARDERVRRRVGTLGDHARAALRPGRLLAVAAIGTGLAGLGLWALRRGRVRTRQPAGSSWLGLVWPMLLQRRLGRRLPPGLAVALGGVTLTLVQRLLDRDDRPPPAAAAHGTRVERPRFDV